ncbi:hypothetical protein PPTG_05108 [Phytophthora nicotianae INRA-310]|uniref:Nucleotide-diphospho-sugar transferase n=1 Tax=Phytophthora nicotianae (strain INRA-310) TaxID=761204 RepID=W2QVM2_PHYN3|nr:hypothetical protein PPTG_05108 [Phytophthora nicotianae INRA-310]ETN17267.1 hypothetical protein PPTG_05108 [Phytophthora nicotianae INRA-310]
MSRVDRSKLMWLLACVWCFTSGVILCYVSTTSFAANQYQALPKSQWPRSKPLSLRLQHHTDNSPTEDKYARGIVMCLHNGIAAMGASLIRELRCLGNTEIIQVYYCFPEEISEETRALLTRNDPRVELVDVCTEVLSKNGSENLFQGDVKYAKTFQSYWIKPLALYHTKIREVILLDGDAVLLRDPAALRTLPGYVRTGTTFFRDRIAKMDAFLTKLTSEGEMYLHYLIREFPYDKFGLSGAMASEQVKKKFSYRGETAHEMDSSMVLIDKTRAGKALDILRELIFITRFYLQFSWGDKEAFWLAYELAHQDYFFSPWGMSQIESVPNDDRSHLNTMCGSMAHFIPTENETEVPEVLYFNGKALLQPFPNGVEKTIMGQRTRMYNLNPAYVSPRYRHDDFDLSSSETFECMDNMGSVPLPPYFFRNLLRRRFHYFAAEMNVHEALDSCPIQID